MEHLTVRANDASFHVARTGSGRPLLLLHGWPEFWLSWEPVMTRLADRFTLYAPDLRALGRARSAVSLRLDRPARRDLLQSRSGDVCRCRPLPAPGRSGPRRARDRGLLCADRIEPKVGPPDATKTGGPVPPIEIPAGKCGFASQRERRDHGNERRMAHATRSRS